MRAESLVFYGIMSGVIALRLVLSTIVRRHDVYAANKTLRSTAQIVVVFVAVAICDHFGEQHGGLILITASLAIVSLSLIPVKP